MDKIQEDELKIGKIYKVVARNFNVAVWTGTKFKGPAKVDGKYEFVTEGPESLGYPQGTAWAEEEIGSIQTSPPYDGSNFLAAMQALDELLEKMESNK